MHNQSGRLEGGALSFVYKQKSSDRPREKAFCPMVVGPVLVRLESPCDDGRMTAQYASQLVIQGL
jgi:hypothetical protein